jgi:colicin import membrane protein
VIGAAWRWIRSQPLALGLSVLLHVVIGALLIMGSSLHGASPQDMPGRGSEHQPIQAVVVNSADYEAAENSIKKAQAAKEAHASKLKAEAEQAQKAREKAEHELAQLKQQRQSTASDVASQQKKLQDQSKQLQQLKDQASKMAQERKAYQDRIAKLKAQAEQAQKAQAEEKARLDKAKKAAEAARKAQVQAQMQAEQEQAIKKARGNWVAAISRKVIANWIRPPSAQPGVDCFVKITQLPSGQVVSAKMEQCNGDSVVKQSIITAVLKASPLPTPEDPQAFSRQITFEFTPDQ